MTETQLTALIRTNYTKTTTATLPNAELQPLMNAAKDEIASLITEKKPHAFTIEHLDTFTAAQRRITLPNGILNFISYVEIAFKNESPLPYVKVRRMKREDYAKALVEANINGDFTNDEPWYFIENGALYLLSGKIDSTTLGFSTLASGVRIVASVWPEDFGASLNGSSELSNPPSTTTFGFPRQFHELLARRVSIMWKQLRPKPIPLSALELNYERDLQKQLDAISMDDLSEEIIGRLPATQNGMDL